MGVERRRLNREQERVTMPRKKKGHSKPIETRVNIQIHLRLPKLARDGRKFSYTENFVKEVIDNWIDTGDLPVFVSIDYIDWEIVENGRPRAGRIGGNEAERWRDGFIRRFRYGLSVNRV